MPNPESGPPSPISARVSHPPQDHGGMGGQTPAQPLGRSMADAGLHDAGHRLTDTSLAGSGGLSPTGPALLYPLSTMDDGPVAGEGPPILTPDRVREICEGLRRDGGRTLRGMAIGEIVEAAGRAAAGWSAGGGRQVETVARLAHATGYHPAMVALALDDLAQTFRAPALDRLLRRELDDPNVLDRFVACGSRLERAYGPELITVVLTGNVFHVAAEAMILALLAKSPCLVKTSSRDPIFPALFAASLAAADPRLGDALAVGWWRGGDAAIEERAFAADTVIAYGGTDAIGAVRSRVPPATRLIAHGPKLGFAVVGKRAADADSTAAAAAHDVSWLDQQGCVSPHTIYVEGPEEGARVFARALAAAMARTAGELPRGVPDPGDAAAVHQARGAAEFRAGVDVFAGPGTAWTVIFDPDPAFAASCLNRVVWVKPLERVADLPVLLSPARPYLQTCGVAGGDALRVAVAEITGPLGVSRVCPLGRMQHPPADWRHDGRPRLLDLLRWTEVERFEGCS